jgi:hypothetical protein
MTKPSYDDVLWRLVLRLQAIDHKVAVVSGKSSVGKAAAGQQKECTA